MIKEISEKDWRLFREKLPIWQDNYMDKLNQEYIEILSSSDNQIQSIPKSQFPGELIGPNFLPISSIRNRSEH